MKKSKNTTNNEEANSPCPSLHQLHLLCTEGKTSPYLQKHINQCNDCQRILESMESWQAMLMADHPLTKDSEQQTQVLWGKLTKSVYWHNARANALRIAAVVLLMVGLAALGNTMLYNPKLPKEGKEVIASIQKKHHPKAQLRPVKQTTLPTPSKRTKPVKNTWQPKPPLSHPKTLYLIVVGDTSQYQQVTRANLRQLRLLTQNVASLGLKVQTKLVGNQEQILQLPSIIEQTKVSPEDVFWVYYTGEGEEGLSPRDIYKNYYKIFGMHAPLKSLEVALKNKQVRLKLITADYQDNQPDMMVAMPQETQAGFDKKVLSKLFLESQGKIVFTSQTKLNRYYAGNEGSLLMNSLISSLKNLGSTGQSISWEGLFMETGQRVFTGTQYVFPGQQTIDYHISAKP